MSQNSGLLSDFLEEQRINQVVSLLPAEKIRILDIGCGDSKIVEFIADKIKSYTGIDLLADQIKNNQKKYSEYEFISGDISDIDLSGKYDMIILIAFIEHLAYEDNIKLFRKLSEFLTNDGQIIMTTPHPRANSLHQLGAKLGIFSREAAHEHKCFFDRELLEKLAGETGYSLSYYQVFQFGLNQVFVYEKK